jgi:AcrR family transcriptional regulator
VAVNRSTERGRAPSSTSERTAQKRRTRKAIVDAAIRLIAEGHTPSVEEVAAAADVSRRTVYMYFPTFDQLLLDATAGALSQPSVERALEAAAHMDNVDERVRQMTRAIMTVTPDVERLGRALIRLTIDSRSTGLARQGLPRRGYRRIGWIETAVGPLRKELGPVKFRRLVNALAMVVGWEALVVQRDVCGLTAHQGQELSVWAACALVAAARGDR